MPINRVGTVHPILRWVPRPLTTPISPLQTAWLLSPCPGVCSPDWKCPGALCHHLIADDWVERAQKGLDNVSSHCYYECPSTLAFLKFTKCCCACERPERLVVVVWRFYCVAFSGTDVKWRKILSTTAGQGTVMLTSRHNLVHRISVFEVISKVHFFVSTILPHGDFLCHHWFIIYCFKMP